MVARTPTELKAEILRLLPDNTTEEISPADERSVLNDIVDSFPTDSTDQTARDAAAAALLVAQAAQKTADDATTPAEAKDVADQEILDTVEGLDIVSVASGGELLAFLGRHEAASEYGLVQFTRDTLQVYKGHNHQYRAGDVALFRPANIDPDDAEVLFTIPYEFNALKVETVGSQAAFLALLNAQVNSPTPTLAYFPQTTQAERGAALYDAGAGDVVLFPAFSITERKTLFKIPPGSPRFTIFTKEWLRGIINADDLDGDYFLVIHEQAQVIPQQYRPGSATADPIDNLRLFVVANDGTKVQIHVVQNYVYRNGVAVVPFNISVAEEGPAARAIASTPGRVVFSLEGFNQNARQSGPFLEEMPINAGFTVPAPPDVPTLPPFNTVALSPGGISGDDMVKRVRVLLHERNPDTPQITNVQLSISGQVIALAESSGSPITPVSTVASSSKGELVFELTDAQVTAIGDNITGTQIDVEVTFTFATASGRAAHIENLTFGTNDPAFAAPDPAPAPAPSDTEIGGALALSSRNSWNEYTITEAIEAGSLYQFVTQPGSDAQYGHGSIWKGSELLALPVTASATLNNSSRNFMGAASPRPDADGVRTFKFARHQNPLRIWVNIANPYNVVKLVKIGR